MMFHNSLPWITPSVVNARLIPPPLLFAPPLIIIIISVCPYSLTSGHRDAGVGNVLLQLHTKLHCRNSRFVLVSASSSSISLARDLTYPIRMEKSWFKPPLSLSSLSPSSASTATSLQLVGDLESQFGYNLTY